MGLVYANITIFNGEDLALKRRGYLKDEEVRKIAVNALVDSGAYMLTINEEIRMQLDLPKFDEQEVELAGGKLQKVDIVGPVVIKFENRKTTVNAVVLPEEKDVLLGAIPMEDMDVIIDPKQQVLMVNPAHPYLAKKYIK